MFDYQEALIKYGPNYRRNIRKAIGFNYIWKAGVLITYGTQKRSFSAKKGPCGHAHTQKTIFTKKHKGQRLNYIRRARNLIISVHI